MTGRNRFFYDYVDPLSFLLERSIRALESEHGPLVERSPFELRAPPGELIDPEDPSWVRRVEEAARISGEHGVSMVTSELVPWTRKAHELALFAREKGRFEDVHRAIFEAALVEGRDVGRVDMLVRIAGALGFEPTETKAVLDVDRHAATVDELRGEAERHGVRGVPTLLLDGELIEGWMDVTALRARLTAHTARSNDMSDR